VSIIDTRSRVIMSAGVGEGGYVNNRLSCQ